MEAREEVNLVVYVIDTSALIKLDYDYKKEIPVFTAVWEEMEHLIEIGRLKTLDIVKEEVYRYQGNQDVVREWVKAHRAKMVEKRDEAIINATIPIIEAEKDTGLLNQNKLAEGIDEADPYLIAYCYLNGYTLITNESKNKPGKLPQDCARHDVRCFDVVEFMHEVCLKMQRRK